jgi:cytochrome c oxidase assembly factor CtaG
VIALAVAALAYLAAAHRVPGWPRARTAAWLAGLAVLAACVVALDGAADRRLSAHMLQHVGLTLFAPPLLLLGAPARLALRATGGATRRALARTLRGASVLSRPVVAWALFCGTLAATHLTGIYEQALQAPVLHAAEHAALFWTAVLFWLPLAGAAPVRHRLGPLGALAYLVSAMPVMAAIAIWLDGDTLRYAAYAGPGALADQHAAAAIMLVGGALATLAAALGCVWPALLRQERRQRAREAVAA